MTRRHFLEALNGLGISTAAALTLPAFPLGNLALDEPITAPKYLLMRILSQYDPGRGLTPELLASLNAAGVGHYTAPSSDVLQWDGESIDVIGGPR